jgi:hypothetical protein
MSVDCNPTEDKPSEEETGARVTSSGANEALLLCRTSDPREGRSAPATRPRDGNNDNNGQSHIGCQHASRCGDREPTWGRSRESSWRSHSSMAMGDPRNRC